VTETQTLLCFDFGTKRIGVAVGQTVTETASPLETILVKNGKVDWDRITGLIQKWQPSAFVVGEPLTLEGNDQEVSASADRFSRQLNGRYNLTVHRHDERFSSNEARRRLKDITDLDPVAAQVILESWLTRLHGSAV